MRPACTWRLRARTLALGPRTLIMGVVNVTPDSFSDAGRFLDPARATEHALRLLDEGADMLDIGGESTRPGAHAGTVSAEEELARILPVIAAVHRARPDALISVDTYKAAVARAAAEAGAEIVNDVSALRWDAQMAATVAALGCGAVLMHMRGRPDEWRSLPPAGNIVALVSRELAAWAQAAVSAGVARDRLVLDPGFGFGKNFEENYPLLDHFEELHRLGFPLLAGTSRKSFIGRALTAPAGGPPPPPEQRLYGSLAAMVITILKGAHIVRVHDVRPARDAAALADAILASGGSAGL
jgi:dihydropteroate synthase